MKYSKNKSGFTLIELVIVTSLILIISGVGGAILYSSLRGATKASTTTIVRQNGSYAMNVMTDLIRSASDVPLCPSSGSSITISDSNNQQTIFTCPALNNPCSNSISSNSAQLTDSTLVCVTSCSFMCTQNSAASLPTIGISFTLQSLGTQEENKVSIPFQTQLTPRTSGL